MKYIFIIIAYGLFIKVNAQSNFNQDSVREKSITQSLLDFNNILNSKTNNGFSKFDSININTREQSQNITSYLNFSDYYRNNQSTLFIPTDYLVNKKILLEKDSVNNYIEKYHIEISPISIEECEYRNQSLLLEKCYIFKVKEVQSFYYLDEMNYPKAEPSRYPLLNYSNNLV